VAGDADPFLRLLSRLHEEDVRYILVGGHAVRLNGFLRNTEDIDLLMPLSSENGERTKRALDFLPSSRDLAAAWFEPPAGEPENIRIADEILVDILFAANGETFESLQPHVITTEVQGVPVVTLDIEGLLKTKTTFRDKDRIDREALGRLLQQLGRAR
jgi:hypothetical protein